jgi:peroxiredoxin family protein
MAEKVTILLTDDTLDKACVALNIAIAAASADKEVSIFFTCWSLRLLKRAEARWRGDHPLNRFMNFLTGGGASRLPLSKFNFLGLGSWAMRRLMAQKRMQSIPEMLDMARELEVKFYVCDKPADVFGLDLADLDPGVAGLVAAPSFVLEALRSQAVICL